VAFSGYEQEPYAAMVRYEDLRESDEGAAVQGAASWVICPIKTELVPVWS